MIYVSFSASLTCVSGGIGQTSLQLLSEPLVGPDGVLQTLAQCTDLTQMLLNQIHTWQNIDQHITPIVRCIWLRKFKILCFSEHTYLNDCFLTGKKALQESLWLIEPCCPCPMVHCSLPGCLISEPGEGNDEIAGGNVRDQVVQSPSVDSCSVSAAN